MRDKKYFILGLVILHIVTFFSPNKIIYFAAYFISPIFFYLHTKNLRKSLVFSLILSFFTEMGMASSLFRIEPFEINVLAGWWISPMTLLILTLIPMLLKSKFKIHTADIFAILFLFWHLIILIIYPYSNVLYGIISLTEILIAYIILRTYLTRDDFEYITYIVISVLLFQAFVGGLQFLFQKPIGVISELSNYYYPFGLTAAEEKSLFRVSGTYSNANMLAVVLVTLIPFIIHYSGRFANLFRFFSIMILFFTYSRAAWIIGIMVMGLIIVRSNKFSLRIRNKLNNRRIALLIGFFLVVFFLLPYFTTRIDTISQAFEEGGSMDTRYKLIKESWNLIQQYPLFGVGVNKFQEMASLNSVTGIFRTHGFYAGTKIHNLFLEIATETGLPGVMLFIFFLWNIFFNKSKKSELFQISASYCLLSLILASLFHPIFQSSQFRLFFLLASFILI